MVNAYFVFNCVCIAVLASLYLLQFVLWNRWNSETRDMLKALQDCEDCQRLRSAAQKFAVYLAIRRAALWDSLMERFGKTLAPVPAACALGAGLFKLQSQNAASQMQSVQMSLYAAVCGQLLCLLILLYVEQSLHKFRTAFPATSRK
jgi:hypothetical protein